MSISSRTRAAAVTIIRLYVKLMRQARDISARQKDMKAEFYDACQAYASGEQIRFDDVLIYKRTPLEYDFASSRKIVKLEADLAKAKEEFRKKNQPRKGEPVWAIEFGKEGL